MQKESGASVRDSHIEFESQESQSSRELLSDILPGLTPDDPVPLQNGSRLRLPQVQQELLRTALSTSLEESEATKV